MTTSPINLVTHVRSTLDNADPIISLSQRALAAQGNPPDVAATNSSTAVPASAAAATAEPAFLDEIYQWLVHNQGKLTGTQAKAMESALLDKLKSAKTPEGKNYHQSYTELMNSVDVLSKKFTSADKQTMKFLTKASNDIAGINMLMVTQLHDTFFKEVKIYGEPE